ncbi:MAG: hypothetical protein ACXWM7_01000 [Parachlamydiaceae bacterium]
MVFKVLLTLFIFVASYIHANQVKCEKRLLPYLQAIQAFSEGKELVQTILKEGSFQIKAAENHVTQQFHACWDPQNRMVLISFEDDPKEEDIMASLVFELHNATKTSQFADLDRMAYEGRINKKDYVVFSEYVEYVNSLNASKIVKAGIKKGLFPKKTYLHAYKNFEEYLHYQKLGGHSAAIGRNFDMLSEP